MESQMNPIDMLFRIAQRVAEPLLRFALGLVLVWIAALKFYDPTPVRGLLAASLPVFAHNEFVYVLGSLEILAALALFAGIWVRYVGLGMLFLFGGTLTIFLVAPAIVYGPHGFPVLSLLGQFLLKDTVLAAAAINLVALDSRKALSGKRRTQMPMAA